MRCPKCHYLSFDPEPRCKNCGYDLEVADTDLALRNAESAEPSDDLDLADLPLRDRSAAAAPITLELVADAEPPVSRAAARLMLAEEEEEQEVEVAVAAPPRPVPFRAPHTTTSDLPLFVKGIPDREDFPEDATIGLARQAAAPPRPPLAVRRTAPATAPVAEFAGSRTKPAERRLGPLDRDLLEDLKRVEREESAQARAATMPAGEAFDAFIERVPASHRFAAAAVDVGILGGIAAFVVWATLRLCDASLAGLGVEALVPLLIFLGAMDAGYLLMFTAAGGQTVGKMLMHIRVVGDDADGEAHVTVRQAAWRAVLTIVSVAGLGAGWLPAMFGSGLAVHDRLAHTRVVRA